MEMIKRFFKDEEGATAVEYGIMVAAIAAVIIGIVFAIGTNVKDTFTEVDTAITNKGVTPDP
ncbi:MAG TPA: Flp family type IVb pilin [Geopsychrobacteraceae bacterium]